MQTIIKGEKRYIPVQVTRRRAGAFTIESASYNVESIQQGDCLITQADKEVYFLLDTTLAGFQRRRKYVAEFTVIIEGMDKILKGRVIINIV